MLVDEYASHYGQIKARLYGPVQRPVARPKVIIPEDRRRAILARVEACRPPPAGTLARLLADVAAKHGVRVADMRGPRRFEPILHARHEYFYHAYMDHPDKALVTIAKVCGKDDHSTVCNGAAKHAERHGLPFVARGQGTK